MAQFIADQLNCVPTFLFNVLQSVLAVMKMSCFVVWDAWNWARNRLSKISKVDCITDRLHGEQALVTNGKCLCILLYWLAITKTRKFVLKLSLITVWVDDVPISMPNHLLKHSQFLGRRPKMLLTMLFPKKFLSMHREILVILIVFNMHLVLLHLFIELVARNRIKTECLTQIMDAIF